MSEENDENWDFDFSQYEEDYKKQEEEAESVHAPKPLITGYRSRFSMGEYELERLSQLKNYSSKYAILVQARSQNITELWKFYAVLEEIWDIISPIFGTVIEDEITDIKIKCRDLLMRYGNGKIPDKVFNYLRHLKKEIYRLMQMYNLGFEVDKVSSSQYQSAKRKITQ